MTTELTQYDLEVMEMQAQRAQAFYKTDEPVEVPADRLLWLIEVAKGKTGSTAVKSLQSEINRLEAELENAEDALDRERRA